MHLTVYLAGEIHSDWRSEVADACVGLDLAFLGPVTDHAASDDCGAAILGPEPDPVAQRFDGAVGSARQFAEGSHEECAGSRQADSRSPAGSQTTRLAG